MKPITKILVGFVTIVVVAQLVYMLAGKGLQQYYNHEYQRQQEILLNNTRYDVLFIGSSRMHSGVNPAVVDSVTGLNTFNAANDGGRIYEIKSTLDAFLVNHPVPDLLVVNIDYTSFNTRQKFFNPTIYFPFLQNNVIFNALRDAGEHAAMYKWIPFTRFTAYDDYTRANILKGFSGKHEVLEGQLSYKGFLSSPAIKFKPAVAIKKEKTENDSLGIEMLKGIIDTCNARGVKVMFVYAPDYHQYGRQAITNFTETMGSIESIAKRNNIPFYYYDSLPMCSDSKYFTDVRHVNKYGAGIYSAAVANHVMQLLNKASK